MSWRLVCACCVTCLLSGPLQSQEQARFDQLVLQSGERFEGVVIEEQPQQIRFQYLHRKPGVRTLVFDTYFDRGEIARLVKAPEPGRTLAKNAVESLAKGKSREEALAKELNLRQAAWIAGTGSSWLYQGKYFTLQSNAQEDLVRLICIRLDEIFAAYVKTLGSRQQAAKPTRILVFASMPEFQAWQQKRALAFLNPAYYDQARNEIIVGCDLGRLEKDLADLRRKHDRQLQEIAAHKEKLQKHFQGQPPPAQLKLTQQLNRQLQSLNSENEAALAKIQSAFFATLYHEAFHAYLDNWVFPSSLYLVPRWLNEGLAQLFEHAFVEIGLLRVGRIDENRLLEIQDDVRKGRFLSLREILLSPPEQFFVSHTLEAFQSQRQYAAAWALVHFLIYELKLLENPRLPEYLKDPKRGHPIGAFESLTGLSLEECEKRWHSYLLRLRTDGSLRP